MRARIYRPARNAMQSGTARTKQWVLEFTPGESRVQDPLMGWTGSGDTQTQVKLRFSTLAKAEAYAKAQMLEYNVSQPKVRAAVIRANGYAENFATNRKQVWTH